MDLRGPPPRRSGTAPESARPGGAGRGSRPQPRPPRPLRLPLKATPCSPQPRSRREAPLATQGFPGHPARRPGTGGGRHRGVREGNGAGTAVGPWHPRTEREDARASGQGWLRSDASGAGRGPSGSWRAWEGCLGHRKVRRHGQCLSGAQKSQGQPGSAGGVGSSRLGG